MRWFMVRVWLVVLVASGLMACGSTQAANLMPEGTPTVALASARTPIMSKTPSPTLTFTPTLTPSPLPTDTPEPTPILIPTDTPEPTPTATPRPPTATPWPTPDGPLTWDERALLFDELWKVINERYIDPNFNGVNWAAVRDYRRPRALNAPNDEAYYLELREMVWALDDGHSRFMTPSEATEHFALSRNEVQYGGFGLYTMPTDNGALVLQVNAGSPAERAGIAACDVILSLDGRSYEEDRGVVGTTGTLTLARPNEGNFSLTLAREEVTQVLDVPGEVLPNRARRIGYVRLDTLWVMDIPDRLRARIAELEATGPLDGLILDLRPNLGGWRPVLQGVLGTFIAGQFGEFSGRIESDPLMAPRRDDPPPSHPDLPLAVLISPRTESYAEVLAATLQAERGAIVIGQQTQGNVETIYARRLPFSARVWVAEQGFRLNNGNTLEGIGVIPDVVDATDWTRYPCARDPQVDLAARLLEEQSAD